MHTVVRLPEGEIPCTIREVVSALNDQKLEARHEKKDWGDWITLGGTDTVISIESLRGLTSTATIEHGEEEPEGLSPRLQRAFHEIGWVGVDDDGLYPLG
ncbi:MAG: hypothetical protein GWM87_04395 [Xanthomonadales bacterium]|nr:hypothetical protein [Xanthomonadales bacterium]NIX12249.1 hypothetical protein [Xanthomonadales bacterium]